MSRCFFVQAEPAIIIISTCTNALTGDTLFLTQATFPIKHGTVIMKAFLTLTIIRESYTT